jgi:hypothetical protein
MAEKLGVIRPPVQAILDTLKDVPVDIEPRYVTAQQLESNAYSPAPPSHSLWEPKTAD